MVEKIIDEIDEMDVLRKLTPMDKGLNKPIVAVSGELTRVWADYNDHLFWDTLDHIEGDREKAIHRIKNFEELGNESIALDNEFRNGMFFALTNLLKLKHQVAETTPFGTEQISREAFEESWERTKQKLREEI